MSQSKLSPWATGPAEILEHGLELLEKNNHASRRFAMIAIDNAVELSIRTYLSLPKRVTGLPITRKEFSDISESFPKMLDALETYASEKVNGLDLGEIEWFHRLRNQLYHNGNGLTIDKEKVEVYAALAKLLFNRLFQGQFLILKETEDSPLGQFIMLWSFIERGLIRLAEHYADEKVPFLSPRNIPTVLKTAGIIDNKQIQKIDELRKLRNKIVHGEVHYNDVITKKVISDLEKLAELIEDNGTVFC